MTDSNDIASIAGLLERVRGAGDGDTERVTVGDMVRAVGDDLFAPLLLVPALLLVSPLSGIPGMSMFVGTIMALIAVQMVLRRPHVWLPAFLLRRSVSRRKLHRALDYLRGPGQVIDRVTGERLSWLVRGPMEMVAAIICLCAAAMIPFLELIPFSSSVLSAAIAFFALALFFRDGLLMLIGLATLGGAGWLILRLADSG